MSEYMERHTVSKIIGSPPGYVGYEEAGQLTEKVRRRPYAVLLLDEVEKAHPDVFNILLQIFEDGRLTDSKGRVVSFKNTIIIMTSNLGSDYINKMSSLGFNNKEELVQRESMREKIFDTLRDSFRPEFLNRIDEIVVFTSLNKDDIKEITRRQVKKSEKMLKDQGISLVINEKAIEYLVDHGYNDEYGARPLRRLIQKELDNVFSDLLIKGDLVSGDLLSVLANSSGLVINVSKTAFVAATKAK